jgi:hypothetical protein
MGAAVEVEGVDDVRVHAEVVLGPVQQNISRSRK